MAINNHKASGSVRIGPVTIITFVVLLSIAVLSVLSFATANANYSEAIKQKEYLNGTYANDRAAQEMLAQIDEILAQTSQQGGTLQQAEATMESTLPDGVQIGNDQVTVTYTSVKGRLLTITVDLNEDLTCTVSGWRMTNEWDTTYQDETLWQETEE